MAKSKIVNHEKDPVYQALELIPCDRCKRAIQPGEMFSRFADRNGTVAGIRYTFCNVCSPLAESD